MPIDLDSVARAIVAAPVGLIFGSFVTALSFRVPRRESIARGRSRCPACGHVLGGRDLIPVLSWVLQGGCCRHCGIAVSVRYPAIEATSCVLFVATALLVGDPLRLALIGPMVVIGLALAVVDLEHQRLPNALVGLLLPVAILWRWRMGHDLMVGMGIAVFVYIALLAMDLAFLHRTGEAAISGGDIKLIALAALCLPFPRFLTFLVIGSGTGMVLGVLWRQWTGQRRFPFGVNLVTAWWLCLVLPPLRGGL